MAFPALPKNGDGEELFLIQDDMSLRDSIFPIWDYHKNGEQLQGLGTAFRVDRIGICLTAFHVLEHHLERAGQTIKMRSSANPLGMDNPGWVYGAVPLDPNNWMSIAEFNAVVGMSEDRFVGQDPQNLTELIRLKMPSKKISSTVHKFVPVGLSTQVNVGERLMAVGFPEMNTEQIVSEEEAISLSAYMKGSIRTVIQVEGVQQNSSRPWPKIVVDGDWPAGMSGGPVFNEAGVVVGVVSTGSPLGGYATARAFAGDNITEYLLPHLDQLNSGSYMGWAVVVKDEMRCFCLDEEEAYDRAAQVNGGLVRRASKSIEGEGYMLL